MGRKSAPKASMPRYKITIEYDGTGFVGWQKQDNGPSIQSELIRSIKAFCGEEVDLRGAGRTDAGVHALGQVAHFDLNDNRDPGTIRDAVNQHLKPLPIAVLECAQSSADFDARFSARQRHYIYRIINRRAPLTLDLNRAWCVNRPLDVDEMHRAAQSLVGHHDFTTFRSAHCQAKSPLKTIERIELTRSGTRIIMEISARSFMHNQVRSIMGSLKLVGEGKWTSADLVKALKAKDRAMCGPLAPPHGLYLARVDYQA